MNVMSYEIDNKGNIENLEYSKSSQIYFTKKEYQSSCNRR